MINGLFMINQDKKPDYVVCKLSIDAERFIRWLRLNKDNKGRIYLDILKTEKGEHYAKKNDWRPTEK